MRSPAVHRIGLVLGSMALTAMAVTTACSAQSDREPAQSTPVPTEKGSVLTPAPQFPTTAQPRN